MSALSRFQRQFEQATGAACGLPAGMICWVCLLAALLGLFASALNILVLRVDKARRAMYRLVGADAQVKLSCALH